MPDLQQIRAETRWILEQALLDRRTDIRGEERPRSCERDKQDQRALVSRATESVGARRPEHLDSEISPIDRLAPRSKPTDANPRPLRSTGETRDRRVLLCAERKP